MRHVDDLHKSLKRHVKLQAQTTPGLWYILTDDMGLVDWEWKTHVLENLRHDFLEYISSPIWLTKHMPVPSYWWITRRLHS